MNQRIALSMKRIVCGVAAVLVMFFAPVPYVFAEGADSTAATTASTSCSPAAPAPTGIQKPTGSMAGTYTYNSCTGLWENQYYTWSPATQQTTPKYAATYRCDTTIWKWVTNVWEYSPATSSFYQAPVSQSVLPAGAIVAPDSLNPCAPTPAPTQTSPAATQPVTTTGSNITSTNNSGAVLNNQTSTNMHNTLGTTATTGDASVLRNMTGGSATTGNAAAMATVINNVQTTSALNDPNVVKFVANVDGNVQGDLLIDPSVLQPASNSNTLSNNSNVTINNQASGQINNDISVGAQTGNAKVAENTVGGNATTGNATAIANVVNMLNSIVSAGKSFVGVVNINGNLNGNILVPQSLVDSLIASNTPSTTVNLTTAQANSLGMANTNNQAISNNLTNSAASGTANLSDNTTAGSATTGNATTKVTIFNLTGNQIIGANCLLVFVNVSGKWVGMIMNAPAGATAAALGSGITENAVNNAVLANKTTNAITNNITTSAASGNADVDSNTRAGSAQTGNANTAVNLLNMDTSQLSLTGWFGILFINVFGNWYGNFGAFTPPAHPSSAGSSGASGPNPSLAPRDNRMFKFAPRTSPYVSTAAADPDEATPFLTTSTNPTIDNAAVLGTGVKALHQTAQTTQPERGLRINSQAVGALLVVGGLAMLLSERVLGRRAAQSKASK